MTTESSMGLMSLGGPGVNSRDYSPPGGEVNTPKSPSILGNCAFSGRVVEPGPRALQLHVGTGLELAVSRARERGRRHLDGDVRGDPVAVDGPVLRGEVAGHRQLQP